MQLNSTSNGPITQLKPLKFLSSDLTKIKEDPLTTFLTLTQKITLVATSPFDDQEKAQKKFIVALFYNHTLKNPEFPASQLKVELNKVEKKERKAGLIRFVFS